MTVQQILALAPALSEYLDEFADCFVSPDTRYHLKEYVKGQLSDLPRKNVQRIARLADVPPRTLQEFLSLSDWDEGRLRDTVQHIVARDHAEEQAVGIVDESGHPKKGRKTACVHRDYCGASGKVDNCVMGVHLCYASFDGRFRAMLDSDLYLPKGDWDRDARRREEAAIPASVADRGKHVIALEQLARAAANGVRLAWVTADEWYGEKPPFVRGLEELGLRFVLEIPRNLMGWLREPSDPGVTRGEVQNLVRWSTPMLRQEWAPTGLWRRGTGSTRARSSTSCPTRRRSVPLEVIVHVGFCRWPVERTLEDEKSELGMSDFAVRKYPSVLRHLRITQVSHLFLARQAERLRGEKSAGDDLPGAKGGRRAARRVDPARPGRPGVAAGEGRHHHPGRPEEQRRGPGVPPA